MRPYDPEQVVRDLGFRIAELREERGLTQAEMATRLRYSVQHVSQLENGTNVTVYTLARVANALDATMQALLEEPAERERRPPGRPRRAPQASASIAEPLPPYGERSTPKMKNSERGTSKKLRTSKTKRQA